MRGTRVLVVAGVVAAFFVPAGVAAGAVIDVTSVTPSKVDVSAGITTLDITGTGLAAGDVVSVPDVPAASFSSTVDDGSGGIKVNVEAPWNGPYGTHDLVVTDPGDGSAATCAGCIQFGKAPSRVTLGLVTPGDGTLALAWYVADPGSAPVDRYRVSWADADGPVGSAEVTDPRVTITGLTNGVDYTIQVVASSSWGDSAATVLTERVGTPPDQPTVTGYTPYVFRAVLRTALGETWTLRQQLTWDVRWTAPDGTTGTITDDSIPELNNAHQRGTYVVQTRVHNAVGASPWSAPANVTVIASPSAPRQPRASALGSPVHLSWAAPADDGGSPVTHYVVQVASLSESGWRTFSTTSRSLVLSLPPGRFWTWYVYAVNETQRWDEPAFGPVFDTGTVAAVATTASGTARWLGPGATTWQGLGTRQFASPPTPMRARGRTYFVGSTSRGTVLMRTLDGAWQRLASVPCFDAAAQVGAGHRLWVACRDGSGQLLQLHAYLPADGLPTRLTVQSDVPRPKIAGGPTVAKDGYGVVSIAYRSPVLDRYGHNVRVVAAGTGDTHESGTANIRHIALDCPGTPMIAADSELAYDSVHHYAVACRLDQRHVGWAWVGYPDGSRGKGVATLPFSIRSHIAVGYPAARLQLLVRTSDGVRRYDVATRTWRSLSGTFAQSLVAVTWSL